MTLNRAAAYCQIDDSWEAGKTAAQQVLTQLNGKPDFLLLFATVGHNMERLLQGIQSAAEERGVADIPLVGCSGAGVISHMGCDEANHSVSLMGVQSERIHFHPIMSSELAVNPEQAGQDIATKINALGLDPSENRLLFLFPDSFHLNSTALFRGIEQHLDQHCDIVGGAASNDFHLTKTYQFYNQSVLEQSVSGVLISGYFNSQWVSSNGAKVLGSCKTITKAIGNLIYEIDHQPAIAVLQELMGDQWRSDFAMLNLFTLGQWLDEQGEQIVNRAIFGIDEAAGAIRMGAEIPTGAVFRLTCRNADKVLSGTQAMAEQVIGAMKNPDEALYFYFNCAGRGSYLFGEPDPDVNCLLDELGRQRPLVGFFSFAEIAPIQQVHHLHNYTGIFVGIEE
jgi:hypothetical protein